MQPMLSKAVMISEDLLVTDTRRIQQLALYFDQILTWSLPDAPLRHDEALRREMDIRYLREQGVLLRCTVDMDVKIIGSDGVDQLRNGFDAAIPLYNINTNGQHLEGYTAVDKLIRAISSEILFHDGSPISAYITSNAISANNTLNGTAIEVVLNKIPIPPESTPWQDLIQFRKDYENMQHLRKLRLWIQKQAISNTPLTMIKEELADLLNDYEKYMKMQHKRYGESSIQTVLVCALEVFENIANLNFGSALKSLFDIREKRLALTEAELSAPGREISYISRASNEFK